MIRVIATAFFIAVSVILHGQSLDEIKTAAGKNQWDKARVDIDQFLAKDFNARNPEAWQLKALILYKMVSAEPFRNLAPNGYRESFEAYKKYLELEARDKTSPPREHELLFGVCFNEIPVNAIKSLAVDLVISDLLIITQRNILLPRTYC